MASLEEKKYSMNEVIFCYLHCSKENWKRRTFEDLRECPSNPMEEKYMIDVYYQDGYEKVPLKEEFFREKKYFVNAWKRILKLFDVDSFWEYIKNDEEEIFTIEEVKFIVNTVFKFREEDIWIIYIKKIFRKEYIKREEKNKEENITEEHFDNTYEFYDRLIEVVKRGVDRQNKEWDKEQKKEYNRNTALKEIGKLMEEFTEELTGNVDRTPWRGDEKKYQFKEVKRQVIEEICDTADGLEKLLAVRVPKERKTELSNKLDKRTHRKTSLALGDWNVN